MTFELSSINKEILEARDSLFAVMAATCPNLDKDRFYLALQDFILSQAKDEMEATASVNLDELIAPYNFGGEFLIKAWTKWQAGEKKDALKLSASFFDAADSGALIRGINHMNAVATINFSDEGFDPDLMDDDYDFDIDDEMSDLELPDSEPTTDEDQDQDSEASSSSESEARAALTEEKDGDSEEVAEVAELDEEDRKARDEALAEFEQEIIEQGKEQKEIVAKSNRSALLGNAA